jgi:hypothetical protein
MHLPPGNAYKPSANAGFNVVPGPLRHLPSYNMPLYFEMYEQPGTSKQAHDCSHPQPYAGTKYKMRDRKGGGGDV